jgi:hypothetical protein
MRVPALDLMAPARKTAAKIRHLKLRIFRSFGSKFDSPNKLGLTKRLVAGGRFDNSCLTRLIQAEYKHQNYFQLNVIPLIRRFNPFGFATTGRAGNPSKKRPVRAPGHKRSPNGGEWRAGTSARQSEAASGIARRGRRCGKEEFSICVNLRAKAFSFSLIDCLLPPSSCLNSCL